VGDRPADGAAVADLEVADERDRLGQQRDRLPGGGVVLERETPRSSSTRLRSTMCSKRVSRNASIGTRL
jgi:hypothetical protein